MKKCRTKSLERSRVSETTHLEMEKENLLVAKLATTAFAQDAWLADQAHFLGKVNVLSILLKEHAASVLERKFGRDALNLQ